MIFTNSREIFNKYKIFTNLHRKLQEINGMKKNLSTKKKKIQQKTKAKENRLFMFT